ncbi:LolA family protein [Hyphomicrobium sulfonivorans]|uniref:Outer membrane lipoprotein carrier protein LolA n=1 Tax=Hyphomicrobium sulfonivorans TaxID=121290 RepID=A0A109BCJ7_HYPSL|nr:outer-membrane lipoprotein carrier protein LolA [Hyphomicrobium sulfonivorans]KWT66293.1 Outer membrane lipoprotein carrier protein LolA [Hyphomicrobium sulfonivorans]MBI1648558.1 outer-membrane lipoprotein carrier protein LolA [Hyphomicrobium sulfonivorans]NSL70904.1 cell envelope biogenesis protein LolA [Hyphomicrobium sulfonivorans]
MQELKAVAAAALVSLGLLAVPAAAADQPVKAPAPMPASGPKPGEATAGAGSAWSAQVAPSKAGNEGLALDDHQTDLVHKVSQYFAGLDTLQGNFVQTGADNKRMRGKFYVMRPGRFRFDYNRPSRQIVISDGRYLAIQDLDLNNEDRVALDDTPFRLLLRSDVDLVRDAKIMEVQEADDLLVVGLVDKNPNTPGQIKLFMSTKPALELKEWVTKDAQGLDTRVQVSNLAKSVELDSAMFKIQALGRPLGTP